jgi:ABC-type transport system involved in cytochrome c biogenesis ATPase subunit
MGGPGGATTALTADHLTRRFGDLVAVNDVTFEVPAGGVAGFVGPNGSGKSTTIRVLLGLIAASSGTGTVLGEPIRKPQRFAGRVGALIENPAFVGSLSARDNLRSLAALRGGLPQTRIDEVLEIVGLSGRDKDRASTYSLGMKQRLGIAAALLPDPELLVLDDCRQRKGIAGCQGRFELYPVVVRLDGGTRQIEHDDAVVDDGFESVAFDEAVQGLSRADPLLVVAMRVWATSGPGQRGWARRCSQRAPTAPATGRAASGSRLGSCAIGENMPIEEWRRSRL